jgi:hypothetical protein
MRHSEPERRLAVRTAPPQHAVIFGLARRPESKSTSPISPVAERAATDHPRHTVAGWGGHRKLSNAADPQ